MIAPLVATLVPRTRLGSALMVQVRDLPAAEYRRCAPEVMVTYTRGG